MITVPVEIINYVSFVATFDTKDALDKLRRFFVFLPSSVEINGVELRSRITVDEILKGRLKE